MLEQLSNKNIVYINTETCDENKSKVPMRIGDFEAVLTIFSMQHKDLDLSEVNLMFDVLEGYDDFFRVARNIIDVSTYYAW